MAAWRPPAAVTRNRASSISGTAAATARISVTGSMGRASRAAPKYHPTAANFDDWRAAQGGFRLDWNKNDRDTFTLQGDIYNEKAGESVQAVSYTAALFAECRWQRPSLGRQHHGPLEADSAATQRYSGPGLLRPHQSP